MNQYVYKTPASKLVDAGTLPMFTSCCPAWVKYMEINEPELTGHLSTAKSPQQMFGALIKTWFAEREGIDPAEICSVPETPFDDPFGEGSGAGLIFGATGGVMEAALRTVYKVVTGNEMERLEYTEVRGFEVMACPGGCIGGGGNPAKTWSIMQERKRAIYEASEQLPIRQSHNNPAIKKVYETFLGEAGGEKSHKLLHTVYNNRQDLLR